MGGGGGELRICRVHHTDHMKLKKKEHQSVYASVLLRRGSNIIMGG
jgi:transcriptional regulator CtsR